MYSIRFITLPLCLLLAQGFQSFINGSNYQLETEFSGLNFFDNFDFFDGSDPTHGFVTYVDRTTASDLNLISAASGAAYMGVDSSTTLNPNGPGRKSVRISSKKSWTHGLFIADIAHMPGGICGTWPAYWMFGPDWPSSGEIDIIEGVNSQQGNLMSLHSSNGCTVAGDLQRGTLQTSDCDANMNYNSGCGVSSADDVSYGPAFNSNSGGVFATQWTSEYIRIWFFPRGSIPGDISAGHPEPGSWGKPDANFQGSCQFDKYFKNHNIIFDTTFCGDWGNAVWAADEVCGAQAPTCNTFVAENPDAFLDASWSINYLKIYQPNSSAEPTTTVRLTTTSTKTVTVSQIGTSSAACSLKFSNSTASDDSACQSASQTSIMTPTSNGDMRTPMPDFGQYFSSLGAQLSSVKPASQSFGYAMGGRPNNSQFYKTIVTTTYVDLCGCDENTLVTYTATRTISLCSCVHPNPLVTSAEPHIPCYTTEKDCNSCGPVGKVTLTIPYPDDCSTKESLATVQTSSAVPISPVQTVKNIAPTSYVNTTVTSSSNQTHYVLANVADRISWSGWSLPLLFGVVCFTMAVL